jgi:hypothetical protein
LKTKLSHNAVDAPLADGEATLTQFLSDDFRRSVPIEKSVADDLADEFLGTAVVGFGTALLAP